MMLALVLNTQTFRSRRLQTCVCGALVVRQLSYFRMLIKQALVLKTPAPLLLESVSSMRLWRTLKLSRLEVLRACPCGGYTSFFLFDRVPVCASDSNRLQVSKVFQATLVESTQALHISVCNGLSRFRDA